MYHGHTLHPIRQYSPPTRIWFLSWMWQMRIRKVF